MNLEFENLEMLPLNLKEPILAEYLDFRIFLKDFFRFRRQKTRSDLRPYSYAHFSTAADIKSPNYLKLIIDGQRNLSEDMIRKFARALGFNKNEAEEFRLLVLYDQAKDPLERNRHLKDLSEIRVQNLMQAGKMDSQPWEKVPNWIAWVLYALTDLEGVSFEPTSLKKLLGDRATIEEIRSALENLLLGGELVKDPSTGRITRGRLLMQGSEKIPIELVKKLQAELIYLGLESLFRDPAPDREFGSLTVSLTREEFEQLKFELRQLRKRLYKDNAIQRLQSKGQRVYQMNIQLFPITPGK